MKTIYNLEELTKAQLNGERIDANLDLSSLTTLPEGVSLTAGGYLDLSSLARSPRGCDIDNAALICAAPDLLDALIDATDNCLWRSDSDIPLSADESQRIYNKAMTAIAKAKQLTNNNQ